MPPKSGENRGKIKKTAFFIIGLAVLFILYTTALETLPLTSKDGAILVEIAKAELSGHTYNRAVPQKLARNEPVFVSVYQDETRVACTGYTKPLFPLYESVAMLSKRIPPSEDENQEIVITVVGKYRMLKEGASIPVGRGVFVRKDLAEGIVLPQTFDEQKLSDEEALNLAAEKAGFSEFSWDDFEAFTFDAQIFRSRDY
jgi:AMMECR1 domain-containing protein